MRFYRHQSVLVSMKICIVVTDVAMTLLVAAESVMFNCGQNIIYDIALSTE